MGSDSAETRAKPAAAADSATDADNASRDAERSEAAAGSAWNENLNDWERFRISLLRNANYHEDRERFFATLHRVSMFFVVAAGTASIAALGDIVLPKAFAPATSAIVALAGLIDLVFDVSGKARLHASLRRRVLDIYAQTEDTSRSLVHLREQAARVYADEPPCMWAVNAVAYNAAMASFNRPRRYLFKIGWGYRFFRHWCAFAGTQFKTYEELEDDV